jgi:cullin-associated NEDD8-dissociated protein 1
MHCGLTSLFTNSDVVISALLLPAFTAAGGGPAVLSQLDKLVDPLEKTLTAKLKSDAVKQEVSRSVEL